MFIFELDWDAAVLHYSEIFQDSLGIAGLVQRISFGSGISNELGDVSGDGIPDVLISSSYGSTYLVQLAQGRAGINPAQESLPTPSPSVTPSATPLPTPSVSPTPTPSTSPVPEEDFVVLTANAPLEPVSHSGTRSEFGSVVSVVGDVDDSGTMDLAVSTPRFELNGEYGRVDVVLMGADGRPNSTFFLTASTAPGLQRA